jgi:DNA-binding CsgD family transcriptional regulator
MTNDQFNSISRKLDILVKLSALSFLTDKTQQERIKMLSGIGFQPKEIADICGTTANTVRVALSTMRKKPKRR